MSPNRYKLVKIFLDVKVVISAKTHFLGGFFLFFL